MTENNKRIRVQIDLTPARYQKLKALADSEARTISSYCIYHLLLKGQPQSVVNPTHQVEPQIGDAICAYPASAYANQTQTQTQTPGEGAITHPTNQTQTPGETQ